MATVHESLQDYEAAEAGRPHLDLSDAVVIGQLFKTFVILEKGREVILIDQHAAHEAFMFEQYRKQFLTDVAAAIPLSSSKSVSLSSTEEPVL